MAQPTGDLGSKQIAIQAQSSGRKLRILYPGRVYNP